MTEQETRIDQVRKAQEVLVQEQEALRREKELQATVVKQFRADKVIAFRKKRRKGYKKKRGHRQSMTQIKIESIA